MIKAALFDLDGTLQDSEVIWVEATRAYLNDRGASLSYEDAEKMVYGRGWREIFAAMRQELPELSDRDSALVADQVRGYFVKLRDTASIALDTSIDFLRTLAKHMPVAVVSGAPTADVCESVEQLGIREDLQFFYGADDYAAGKPAPDGFLKAAVRLGVDPGDCLVVEDSRVGVEAAKAAGMYCIALVREGRPRQDLRLADEVVGDLMELDVDRLLNLERCDGKN